MSELHLISTIGVRGVLTKLTPSFERTSGHRVSITYGPSAALQEEIEHGAVCDLAILTADSIEHLIVQGSLAAPAAPIAASGVALAVRAGAPKPDIGSVEAFRQTLLAAKSIGHSTRGASGLYFMELIERLGIGREVRAKAKTPAGGVVGDLVARGEAELGIQQLSELLPVAGLDIVGPLPDGIQRITTFAAGVSRAAREPDGARVLIEFLTAPAALPTIEACGMQRP
jgi:molybdate transport system substrate-binding protein